MTLNEYKEIIWSLFKDEIKNDVKTAEMYLAAKLLNEVTELWEIALDYNAGIGTSNEVEDADYLARNKIIDELGDVLWYLCNFYRLKQATNPILVAVHANPRGSMVSLIELTVHAGKLLGMITKKNYHSKPITDQQIRDELDICVSNFNAFCADRDINADIDTIMQTNIDKLTARHKGQQYNADFYTKPAAN